MGFKFQERHMFDIEGAGSFEFDVNNIDALESIQRGYPDILESLAKGQAAMREYIKYCASLGVEDPNAVTVKELMLAVSKNADDNATAKCEELNVKIKAFRDEAFAKCVVFIRGCLGDDAYDKVFCGKGRYMDDHVSLCKALYDDAIEQRDEVVMEERKKLKELIGTKDAAKKTP